MRLARITFRTTSDFRGDCGVAGPAGCAGAEPSAVRGGIVGWRTVAGVGPDGHVGPVYRLLPEPAEPVAPQDRPARFLRTAAVARDSRSPRDVIE